MTPRNGESREDFAARRKAYDVTRWRVTQRTVGPDGSLRSETQRPVPTMVPVKIVDPRTVSRTTTLYNAAGEAQLQWVQEKPEDADRLAIWKTVADELAKDLPRVRPILAVNSEHYSKTMMACYPVGDHHLGMLSWRPETGTSYDLEIGERMLTKAFQHLVPLSPRCARAAIVFLGDFLHYDSQVPETPAHKHKLDADSRFQKMIRAAIRVVRRVIDVTLAWHEHVEIIVEPGNHDPYSAVWLMEALHNLYESEPRISVDTTPRSYHYIRFGKCLVGTHHGDLAKPAALAGIMAYDRPQDWGETEYRTWWTGHIHHKSADDIPHTGVSWESFRILPPADAWAANKGYRSIRDMKAIVLHHEHGEVARHTVNPKMIEEA